MGRNTPSLGIVLIMIPKEEALLVSEFGKDYADYRRRTWRLIPFLF